MTEAPVVFALGRVMFNAANVKFKALSDPAPGKAEHGLVLDCLGTLRVAVAVNRESAEKKVGMETRRLNMARDSRWFENAMTRRDRKKRGPQNISESCPIFMWKEM